MARSTLRLKLESLGERILPATYWWRGDPGGVWSDRTNFRDAPDADAEIPGAPPGAGDTLIFDGLDVDNSVANVAAIDKIIMEAGHTGRIDINIAEPASAVTVNQFEMHNGTWNAIRGSLDVVSSGRWAGGTLRAALVTRDSCNFIIDGFAGVADRNVASGFLQLGGNTTWIAPDQGFQSGNIRLAASGRIDVRGNLYVEGNPRVQLVDGNPTSNVTIAPSGALIRNSGSSWFSVDVPITNRGILAVNSGTMSAAQVTQEFLSGSQPVTRLDGMATLLASNFTVQAGLIEGNGVLGVSNLFMNNGTIHPGLGNGVGTLQVDGHLILGANAKLSTSIDALGQTGKLLVPTGLTNLQGTLSVQNLAFATSQVGLEVEFLRFNALEGNFPIFFYQSPTWTVDQFAYRFAPLIDWAEKSYKLRVERVPVLGANVGNWVFADVNTNGVQDPGEAGIAGVSVFLEDSFGVPVATAVTDARGYYYFTDVAPGSYRLRISIPAGYSVALTDQGTDDTRDNDFFLAGVTNMFTLMAGETKNDLDCGLVLSAPPPP